VPLPAPPQTECQFPDLRQQSGGDEDRLVVVGCPAEVVEQVGDHVPAVLHLGGGQRRWPGFGPCPRLLLEPLPGTVPVEQQHALAAHVQQRGPAGRGLPFHEGRERLRGVAEQLHHPAAVLGRLAERGGRPADEHHDVQLRQRCSTRGGRAAAQNRGRRVGDELTGGTNGIHLPRVPHQTVDRLQISPGTPSRACWLEFTRSARPGAPGSSFEIAGDLRPCRSCLSWRFASASHGLADRFGRPNRRTLGWRSQPLGWARC
jgi:hypothetical protein